MILQFTGSIAVTKENIKVKDYDMVFASLKGLIRAGAELHDTKFTHISDEISDDRLTVKYILEGTEENIDNLLSEVDKLLYGTGFQKQ